MSDRLEPVDESWSSAIAIVAHPDDLEYGAAAAIARWTDQGKHVTYCLATSGEAGIDGVAPAQAGPLREQEQRTSAAIVGVEAVEFWGYPDGTIESSLALRRDVARAVRRHRPQVVITGNYHDSWGPGSPNQADHIAVGRAVLDGVRDAANRWIFPELGDEGLSAWHADTLLAASSPQSTHGVDITDHFDVGVASLEAHSAYLEGLGDNPMAQPREFLEAVARASGTALGCRFAVSFEVVAL
jgi:LmbE family N-acetylglucosaminyl deacetylase